MIPPLLAHYSLNKAELFKNKSCLQKRINVKKRAFFNLCAHTVATMRPHLSKNTDTVLKYILQQTQYQ